MSDVGLARFHVTTPLAEEVRVALAPGQAHQLSRVLRAEIGTRLTLFAAASGEWEAELVEIGKKTAEAVCLRQKRAPALPPDHWLVFAPIKGDRVAGIVEKATELGVREIHPVSTRRTVVPRINAEKLSLVAVEAAEQTERLDVPSVHPLVPLDTLLAGWDPARLLIVADETGRGEEPSRALPPHRGRPAAVLIGPEGGFDPSELERLIGLPYVLPISLGPRVLRADTAAIAALTCLQLLLGDWNEKPSFPSRAR